MAIKQKSKSLKSNGNLLSESFHQLEVLNGHGATSRSIPSFVDKIVKAGYPELKSTGIDVFQLNIGKLCNQSCAHCHVDAGPDRTEENMSRKDLERCLEIICTYNITTVDITGGAPELNPNFRWFVESLSSHGVKIMHRCNLTIICSNPKFFDLPDFFKRNKVHVISSLPYFTKRRTDRQRGEGVFEDSIRALHMLNKVGYGQSGSDLFLDLVYNPSGAFLPGNQTSLEAEFKRQLKRRYNVTFNQLYAITNLPISRFLNYLLESGNYETYMTNLVDAFNPATIPGLMCRNTISVGWDGFIYDCDFNQMLDLKIKGNSTHIDDFDFEAIRHRSIWLNQHCFGCTAGAGSSCGGEIVN